MNPAQYTKILDKNLLSSAKNLKKMFVFHQDSDPKNTAKTTAWFEMKKTDALEILSRVLTSIGLIEHM